MTYIYIDDSVHERGNFIISGIVVTNKELDDEIYSSLLKNGFDPEKSEFKSSLSSRKFPKMPSVRSELKNIITNNCQIGLIVLPINQRKNLGLETLKGLKEIISHNNFEDKIQVFIDENYFSSTQKGKMISNELGLYNCEFHFEKDSKVIRGIQLADLVAHTLSTILLEQLKLINKKVKAGENSGYDPEMKFELGFELWATFRNSFLGDINKEFLNGNGMPRLIVEPKGLYISEYCNKKLKKNVRKRFSEIYLGCIH